MNWISDIHQRRPAYLAVVEALQSGIATGRLKPGDRLPLQRLLADFLGLHVNTVNRAMRETARRGLTNGKAGRGTWILDSGGVTNYLT